MKLKDWQNIKPEVQKVLFNYLKQNLTLIKDKSTNNENIIMNKEESIKIYTKIMKEGSNKC